MTLRKILSATLVSLMLAATVAITPVIAVDNAQIITFDYSEIYCAIVNSYKTATVETNVTFNGKNALKVTPNPNSTDETTVAKANAVSLDSYSKLRNVDLTKIRYMSVEYYLDMPEAAGVMQIDLVNDPDGTLKKGLSAYASEPMVTGQWAMATFDFSALEENHNPDMPYLNHFQLRPYGLSTKYTALKETDVCYIGRVSFFTEPPHFQDHESYMDGFTGGTFLPDSTMTRAQACVVAARIAAGGNALVPDNTETAFTDIASHESKKYIAYLESLGCLDSYSGKFCPDKAITRAEFVELIYNIGLLKDVTESEGYSTVKASSDKGTVAITFNTAQAIINPVSFTDVSESHPGYNVIMASVKSGLVNGYNNGNGTFSFKPDKTITRAEAVTVINRARGRSVEVADIPKNISKIFLDVDRTHWAFANIAEATVAHKASNGIWVFANEDPTKKLIEALGEDAVYGYSVSNAKIAELDALEAQRIAEIRATPSDYSRITGKKIYVSSSTGNDKNNGLSTSAPVKTIARANEIASSGDGILLKRGDMWRESVYAKSGLTYSAYGEGPKPFINASPENGADPSKWTLVYEDTATGALVWKYANEGFRDTGVIVLNDGEGGYFGEKFACDFNGEYFYDRADPDKKPYSYTQLGNLQFFHEIDLKTGFTSANAEISQTAMSKATGPLYFRCDYGNPGSVFDSIEFATRVNCVKVKTGVNNVFFDNLCLKYSGFYGISLDSDVKNITVKNCEIGWIGGTITTYNRYTPERYVRLGNGIEIYGAVDGFYIDNNYVYQCYDAGLTHQVSNQNAKCRQDNIYYTNNVVTDCVYSIEYFLSTSIDNTYEREGENILFEGNLLRRAGYGFGSSRPDINNQRHIRTGSGSGAKHAYYNFEIRNNIFDRAVHELVQTYTYVPDAAAKYSGNTYIQGIGNGLYEHSDKYRNTTDLNAKANIQNELGDATAQVYFVPNIPKWEFSYPTNLLLGVYTQKDGNLYSATRDSYNVDEQTEDGLEFARITFNDTSSAVLLDCFNLKKFDVSSGKLYYKLLIRTNDKNATYAAAQTYVTQQDGTQINSPVGYAKNVTVGDESWQQIIIPCEQIQTNALFADHVQIRFAGVKKGSEMTEQSDLYYDIAAWGVFANLESAKAYDLAAAAK